MKGLSIFSLLKARSFFWFMTAVGYTLPLPFLIFLLHHSLYHTIDWLTPHLQDFFLGLGFLLFPLCQFFGLSFISERFFFLPIRYHLPVCAVGRAIGDFITAIAIFQHHIPLFFLGRALGGFLSAGITRAINDDLEQVPENHFHRLVFQLGVLFNLGILLGTIVSSFSLSFSPSIPFFGSAFLNLVLSIWLFYTPTSAEKMNLSPDLKAEKEELSRFVSAFQNHKSRSTFFLFLFVSCGYSILFLIFQNTLELLLDYMGWKLGVFNVYLLLSFILTCFLLNGRTAYAKGIRAKGLMILLFSACATLSLFFCQVEKCMAFISFFLIGAVTLSHSFTQTLLLEDKLLRKQGAELLTICLTFAWSLGGFSLTFTHFFNLKFLFLIPTIAFIAAAVLLWKRGDSAPMEPN